MSIQVLLAKRALVGKELELMDDVAVIVKKHSIDQILPRREYEKNPMQEAQVVDLGDVTLMPGLIECHTHLCIDSERPQHLELLAWSNECELTLIAVEALKRDLYAGITTARCLGDKYYIDVTMKKQIEQGNVVGPRLLVAGFGMKGMHGAGHIGVPHCGPEELRRTARENLKRGVDVMKLFITPGVPEPDAPMVPSFLSPEEISVVVGEAHRVGLPVSAHCIGGEGLKNCIECGVNILEHMYMANEEDIERLLKSDCVVDLTSGIFLDPSREPYLSPAGAEKIRRNRENVRKNLSNLVKAGVPFVLGTDAYHGYLYREVEYAVELGATPVRALKGVTSFAAQVCGIGQQTGSLTVGYDADILAVQGNPLENVSCLSEVEMVMKQGEIVCRT